MARSLNQKQNRTSDEAHMNILRSCKYKCSNICLISAVSDERSSIIYKCQNQIRTPKASFCAPPSAFTVHD